ncbi:MAG: hypothetical protein NC489_42590, partial [Ruminococcus flavefaciens]|nr:hypothetical protein [Ruminococcus flavefaciens]
MYDKAAYMTIGQYIQSLTITKDTDIDNSDLVDLGYDFVSAKMASNISMHGLNKLMYGALWKNVVSYLLDNNMMSKWIPVVTPDARC